jgi:transcriptional regulator with XRE-family HTH domain
MFTVVSPGFQMILLMALGVLLSDGRDVGVSMANQDDPGVYRRKLRVELRKAREAIGMTQRQASEALEWSLSKVIRIEAGINSVSVTDLRAMLQLYKVTDENVIDSLTAAARVGRAPAWWSRYRDAVTSQFAQYLGAEGSASRIQVFHPHLIPGLLQTEDYARELLSAYTAEQLVRRIVELRMERQDNLFEQSDPPMLEFIFGEEALYRMIGGQHVMRKQLLHLLNLRDRPTTSIKIVPNSAGAHPGLAGPFILLGFNDAGDDLLFVEGASGDLVTRDDKEMVAQSIEHFDILRNMAFSEKDATSLLNGLIGKLNSPEVEITPKKRDSPAQE